MTTESKPQLQYAPPLPWHRTRRIQRRFLVGLLLMACALATWKWRVAWDAVRYIWLRHQLAGLALPADKVAFEADPVKAQALLRSDSQYRREFSGDSRNAPMVASWAPSHLAEFAALSLPTTGGFNFRAKGPVVFVGERSRGDDGQRVLLVLRFEGYVYYGNGPLTYTFFYDVYGHNVEASNDVATREVTMPCAGHFDRIFAGQADAEDPTHISFRYVIKGDEGIIDAWLEKNALRMKVRSGPASTQPVS